MGVCFRCGGAGRFLVVGAMGWTIAGAPGQTPIPPQPQPQAQGGYTLQVNSQLVVLDVVVENAKGENVHGLKREDFAVFEGKAPQRVMSFEEVTPPAPGAVVKINSTAELDRLEPQAPVTILVIDELTTKFEDLAFARYSLKKYLNAQGETLTQPTMLISANYRNISVLRDYTTSRQEILNALDHHMADYGTLLSRGQSKDWAGVAIGAAFEQLEGVAKATEGHPGHKNMIWIGRGFPAIDPTQMESDQRELLEAELSACTSLLRRARITLDTIDPVGLSSAPPTQDESGFEIDPFGGQFDFETMAMATGGRALHGRNDVDMQIDETVRDGASFYTITYRPSDPTVDASKPFRNIRVVMKDPALAASTREGYYTTTPPVPPPVDAKGKMTDQMKEDMVVAGMSLLVYDGVRLHITREAAAPDSFTVDVRAADLPSVRVGPAPNQAKTMVEITLLAQTFDKKGKRLDQKGRLLTIAVPPIVDPSKPDERMLELKISLPTGPPAARVRFVLRDNLSGKVGADNFFLVDKKLIVPK
jgi:VWFA-related protein